LGRDNNDFITGWLLPSIKAQLVLVIQKKRAGVSLLFFMRRVNFSFNRSPGLNFSGKPVVTPGVSLCRLFSYQVSYSPVENQFFIHYFNLPQPFCCSSPFILPGETGKQNE
jgi:hypothetical protein